MAEEKEFDEEQADLKVLFLKYVMNVTLAHVFMAPFGHIYGRLYF